MTNSNFRLHLVKWEVAEEDVEQVGNVEQVEQVEEVDMVEQLTEEEVELRKERVRRILRSCGWTIHMQNKKSGWIARGAKRDMNGGWHGQYIAPLHRIDEMDTGEIKAIVNKKHIA